MGVKKIVFLSVFFTSIIAVNFIVFAADAPVAGVDSVVITAAAPQEKSDIQWAWGEVVSLDNQAKIVTIKYLDYETDQEKELVLTIDDKTTFENIKGLDELKLKDTLSIDYVSLPDNKNIAKNISLERPDALASVPAQTQEEVKSAEAPVSMVLSEPTPAAESVSEPTPSAESVSEPTPAAESVSEPTPAAESVSESTPAAELVSEPTPAVSSQAQ